MFSRHRTSFRERRLNDEQALPPFQIVADSGGFLTDAEMDGLIADYAPSLSDSRLGPGSGDPSIRRSRTVFIKKVGRYRWLYRRFWEVVQDMNRRSFGVNLSYLESSIQLARYDASDAGFYDWHTDFADIAPRRKLSVSVQLSRPEDYEGGDLELLFCPKPYTAARDRGTFIVFPSFCLHRVTPVTRGTRWSLVSWVLGPRWR